MQNKYNQKKTETMKDNFTLTENKKIFFFSLSELEYCRKKIQNLRSSLFIHLCGIILQLFFKVFYRTIIGNRLEEKEMTVMN